MIFKLKTIQLISIQVNGKLRGVIEVKVGLSHEEQKQSIINLAMQNEGIVKHLKEKEVIKQIHIPNKIFSFVVK